MTLYNSERTRLIGKQAKIEIFRFSQVTFTEETNLTLHFQKMYCIYSATLQLGTDLRKFGDFTCPLAICI